MPVNRTVTSGRRVNVCVGGGVCGCERERQTDRQRETQMHVVWHKSIVVLVHVQLAYLYVF